MKILCPRCKQTIDLGYLEKKGDQMICCPNCDTVIAATYKKDEDRYYWELYIEQTRPKKPFGGGCGFAILVVIVLSAAIAVARCDRNIPRKPPVGPVEIPAGQFRN